MQEKLLKQEEMNLNLLQDKLQKNNQEKEDLQKQIEELRNITKEKLEIIQQKLEEVQCALGTERRAHTLSLRVLTLSHYPSIDQSPNSSCCYYKSVMTFLISVIPFLVLNPPPHTHIVHNTRYFLPPLKLICQPSPLLHQLPLSGILILCLFTLSPYSVRSSIISLMLIGFLRYRQCNLLFF